MRKVMKVLHSIAACGLIGGLACYMILLVAAPQETPAAYADLRSSIVVISNFVLLPSLALAVVTGLLAMVVHPQFLDKGWAWIKALLGLLMFKGILTIVSAKAGYAETVAHRIANGEATNDVLQKALTYEWATLIAVMVISIANIVLAIWRPRVMKVSATETLGPSSTSAATSD